MNQNNSERVSLVFYVSDETVKGVLIEKVEGGNDIPLAQFSRTIPIKDDSTFDYVISRMLHAFQMVARDLSLSLGHYSASSVSVVLSPSWYHMIPRTVRYESDKGEFAVTEELINKMVNDELEAFATSPITDLTYDAQRTIIVGFDVYQVRLNEYPYVDPVGVMTEEIDVTLGIAVSDTEFIERIKKYTISLFGLEPVLQLFHTLFRSVHEMPIYKDSLSIIVEKKMTEIMFVQNGAIENIVSLPIGYQNVIERLCSSLALSELDVDSALSRYYNDMLSSGYAIRISGALRNARREWEEQVTRELHIISKKRALPNMITLFTRDRYFKVFQESFFYHTEIFPSLAFGNVTIHNAHDVFPPSLGKTIHQIIFERADTL